MLFSVTEGLTHPCFCGPCLRDLHQATSCITHLVSSADPNQFCMTYHGSTETSLWINPHLTQRPNSAQSQQLLSFFFLPIHHQQGPTCITQPWSLRGHQTPSPVLLPGDEITHSTDCGRTRRGNNSKLLVMNGQHPPGQTDGQKALGAWSESGAEPRRVQHLLLAMLEAV